MNARVPLMRRLSRQGDGKGVKVLTVVGQPGRPLFVGTHAANHHEVTLVHLDFDFYVLEAKSEYVIWRLGV